jgi:hypothetical protein
MFAQTSRPHVGPNAFDVSQAIRLSGVLSHGSPSAWNRLVAWPDRVLLLAIADDQVIPRIFLVILHRESSFLTSIRSLAQPFVALPDIPEAPTPHSTPRADCGTIPFLDYSRRFAAPLSRAHARRAGDSSRPSLGARSLPTSQTAGDSFAEKEAPRRPRGAPTRPAAGGAGARGGAPAMPRYKD